MGFYKGIMVSGGNWESGFEGVAVSREPTDMVFRFWLVAELGIKM